MSQGSRFIEDHIISVSNRSFDDFAETESTYISAAILGIFLTTRIGGRLSHLLPYLIEETLPGNFRLSEQKIFYDAIVIGSGVAGSGHGQKNYQKRE